MVPHHVKCSKMSCPNRFVPPMRFVRTEILCPEHRQLEEFEIHGTTRQQFNNRIKSLQKRLVNETLLTHNMVEYNINCLETCPKCDSVESFANACDKCGHCLSCAGFILCVPTPQRTLGEKKKKDLTWAQVASTRKI
jgi:hypothetical protein